MILRKPYAILIKNFRLIHLILGILMVYITYRSNSILSFLSEYIGSSQISVKADALETLFGSIFFISIALVLILTIIIIILMAVKKKPIKFYIYNILTYAYSLVIYIVTFYTIQRLQHGLLDVKTLKLIQDLVTSTILLQFIAILIVIIRATGFNIKSFNFEEDLDKIDINETDNEEFEVNLDVDTDKLLRRVKKRLRYAKYTYIENKFFINIILVLFIGTTSIYLYVNRNIYSKTYSKSESFKTVQFILGTNDSYKTKYLTRDTLVEDGYELVVVRINAKRLYYKKIGLNTGRFILHTNKHNYYHTTEYKDSLNDLGTTYMDRVISNKNFDNYILVFKVKESDIKNKMLLTYTDITNDKVKINIIPNDLNKKFEDDKVTLSNELKFNKSIFNDSIIKIDSFEFSNSFKLDYDYCVEENCYNSVEYVNISASDNYNKTLLKLVGTINYDEKLPIVKNNDLFKFIKNYGILKYKINGVTKTSLIDFKEIKPRKAKPDNTYFIEVSNVLESAESIYFEFNIRNRVYTYILK